MNFVMEEALRTHLEAHWQSTEPFYSYGDWETQRQKDWQRIISRRLPELGKSIAVDGGLFTYMQSKAVFDRRAIETFKQEAGTYDQVSSILHALNKQSFACFIAFCECLIETGQTAIIVDFLTPEVHGLQRQQQQQQPLLNVDVRHVAGEDAAALQVLGVVERRPDEQSEVALPPPAAASTTMLVDFDWKSVIRENFMQLTQLIDPDSGLLNRLQSLGVISNVSADVIKSKKGRVNRVGAILDHVTQFQQEADFVKLCDALTATNQQHVVLRYLTRDAVEGEAAEEGAVSAAAVNRRAVSKTYSVPGSMIDTWRTVLIQNRSAIIEHLDSSDDFVDRLVAYGVMNFTTGELCREEADVVARSEFILDHMQRRASLDMACFCQALDDTGQQHVVRDFFRSPTNVPKSAVQISTPSNEARNP